MQFYVYISEAQQVIFFTSMFVFINICNNICVQNHLMHINAINQRPYIFYTLKFVFLFYTMYTIQYKI